MPLTQNLFSSSDAFDNAAWTKTNTTPTPGAADPFGGAGAYTLVDSVDGSAQSHYVRQGAAIAQTRNAYWSVSVYAKAGAKSWVWIWEAATGLGGSFDLTNGVTGTPSAGTSLVMESAGGGWWKCTITYFSSLSTLGSSMIIQPAVSASVNTYQGAGAVAITIYGAQAAQANWTGPRATTLAKVLNNGNIRNRTALAQNLIVYSEDYGQAGAWTVTNLTRATGIANPCNGQLTATRFTDSVDGGAVSHLIQSIATPDTVGKPYTVSVFAKAVAGAPWLLIAPDGGGVTSWFDLANGALGSQAVGTIGRITPVDGWPGWYRCSVAWTPTAASTLRIYMTAANSGVSYVGAGAKQMDLFGVQVSQTTGPIAYTPTGASAVNTGNPRSIA